MRRYNKQSDLISALSLRPFLSETELFKFAFGYDRNKKYAGSNKKYADLLRRAMEAGKIARISAKVKGNRATYFYYATK